MRVTEYSSLDIIGIDALVPRGRTADPQSFFSAGLLLTVLVGVVAPVLALLTGMTGQASAVFIGIVLALYLLIVMVTGTLVAGWAAAIPVLATFNMGIPLTPYVGTIRVEFVLVDAFLLSFGLFAIVSDVDARHQHVRLVCRLSALFAALAVVIGLLTWIGGYSLGGLWFGINQLRYPLIVFGGVTIAYRYDFRHLVALVISVLSLHLCYAIVESFLGQSLGLSYFGDKQTTTAIQVVSNDPFGLSYTTGLFPGGFVGPSRGLLAICCLVFPIALYWVVHHRTWFIPAYGVVFGTPLLVVISRSDAGMGVVLLSLVAVSAAVALRGFGISALSFSTAIAISAVGVLGFALLYWRVLTRGVFDNSQIRAAQYLAAWNIFTTKPLTGIGGLNFAFVLEIIDPGNEATSVVGIHNNYLAYLAELGVGGFFLYSSVAVIVYAKGLGVYLSENREAITGGMIVIGLVAFHVYTSMTLMYHRPPVMMAYWLLTGGAIAYFAETAS